MIVTFGTKVKLLSTPFIWQIIPKRYWIWKQIFLFGQYEESDLNCHFQVVAVARRKERLESLANILSNKKGQLHPFVADISKPDELIKVFEWTKANVGLLHILINNAGVGQITELADFKIEVARAMYDLNIIALSIATREALKVFKENNIQGHIINMNSITGHAVPDRPGFGLYTSSKHAVTALTESTYLEIKHMKLGAKATVSTLFCRYK